MKPIPPDEWDLLNPLPVIEGRPLRMLELGNKRNSGGTYKAAFTAAGIDHTSVDWNGLDGALPLDLTKPQWEQLGQFDVVTNFGTTEHVEDQDAVWENIHRCTRQGGLLICMTPYPGDWTWHGDWYPTEDFYRQFAAWNGYTIERLYIGREAPRRNWYVRMVRYGDVEAYTEPDPKTLYRNHRQGTPARG